MFQSDDELLELYEKYIRTGRDGLEENLKDTREFFSVTDDVAGRYGKFLEAYDF